MKTGFSHTFRSLQKRIAASALIALAIALPVATAADSIVKIEADTTVANASGGSWGSSASAGYNQVVDIQVVYNNTEKAGSGKTANDLHVKINIPTTAGKSQNITTKTSANNTNTVSGSARVNLNRADAYLQYIPGSAVWKHATSANSSKTTTEKLNDDVVMKADGASLGKENPCQAGSVQVQARVMVPGLTVDKYVRVAGTTNWSTKVNAKSSDTLQYEIAYHNTGNTTQKDVAFRDQLPKGVTYVPGSTKLKNTSYPNGTTVSSDQVVKDGIIVGTYAPGAAAYVMFDAKIDSTALQCGANSVRNIAYVQPQGMNYYYNTADVVVNKTCMAPGVLYVCKAFDVTADNASKTVTISKFQTAQKNAKFTKAVIDWGDGTQPLTTDKPVGKYHQYSDNSFTVTATAHFTAGGKDVTASCAKSGSFTTPATPTELPHTGASQVFGLFGAVTVAGAVAHRLFASRRLGRR